MAFPDTRWSQVSRSQGRAPEARTALADLCAAYYQPVFVFLRSEGRSEDQARELAQEFFARVLGGGGVDGAAQSRGRFRTFLLGAVKHFLVSQRQHTAREKRGGGIPHQPLDSREAAAAPDAGTLPPDAAFDREWALTMLQRTLTSLAEEMADEGRGEQFNHLAPFLTEGTEYGTLESTAGTLGITPAALRVAIHRLRHRYRAALIRELSQTLTSREDAGAELAALKAALRGS